VSDRLSAIQERFDAAEKEGWWLIQPDDLRALLAVVEAAERYMDLEGGYLQEEADDLRAALALFHQDTDA
jgi:hypothetical protein